MKHAVPYCVIVFMSLLLKNVKQCVCLMLFIKSCTAILIVFKLLKEWKHCDFSVRNGLQGNSVKLVMRLMAKKQSVLYLDSTIYFNFKECIFSPNRSYIYHGPQLGWFLRLSLSQVKTCPTGVRMRQHLGSSS